MNGTGNYNTLEEIEVCKTATCRYHLFMTEKHLGGKKDWGPDISGPDILGAIGR